MLCPTSNRRFVPNSEVAIGSARFRFAPAENGHELRAVLVPFCATNGHRSSLRETGTAPEAGQGLQDCAMIQAH
jgi:hypothetical protein